MNGWRHGAVVVVAWHPHHYRTSPVALNHLDEIPDLAKVAGAGDERGPRWYESVSTSRESENLKKQNYGHSYSTSLVSSDSSTTKDSTDVSSFETSESKRRTRAYRECTPCPQDMIRKHTNMGIKWICGSYQRARRTFKSECMMRYRNCEDGTMFVKIADHRCNDDPYHGRHWFYVYRV
ncbi:hypothetical protein NE865_02156 [Phthorimaea operculella]|nr:hypothetical protein NE865_02156 [Phthorimaea operculella]